jgi:hypothetical protein
VGEKVHHCFYIGGDRSTAEELIGGPQNFLRAVALKTMLADSDSHSAR